MNAVELRLALLAHFAGFAERSQPPAALLELEQGVEHWALALCPDQPNELAYLAAFEAAMQQAVEARRLGPAELRLGLALSSASTRAGAAVSYRRALKKYSNSIVFEDLELSLLLVEPDSISSFAPAEVNAFLRDLNRWTAARKAIE